MAAPRIAPKSIHRIGAVFLVLAAVLQLVQILQIVTLSDEVILGAVKRATKRERDRAVLGPLQRKLSDAEVDERVDKDRTSILDRARQAGSLGAVPPWIVKGLFTLGFLAIVAGLLSGRSSPTRLLAGILGLLLVIGLATQFANFERETEFAEDLGTSFMATRYATLVFYPLAAVFCLLFMVRATWKVPEPEKTGNRPAGAP